MNMQETKEMTLYKQGLKSRILETAMQAFVRNGIRAVRMDDVAAELGISKRTLYEIYENKELLLFEGVKVFSRHRREQINLKVIRCKNVMEILLAVYHMKAEEFQTTNPQFYADLMLYPKVGKFLAKENQRVRKDTDDFFLRGIKEGYFREDVNYQLVGQLFEAIGRHVVEKQLYRKYSIDDIFHNLVFVTLRGLCTSKGAKALDSIIQSY